MKTKISFMLLASVLTTGSFIFSSCNNDVADTIYKSDNKA